MKNKLLLSLLLGFGSLTALAEPEPSPPKLIQVQVEFIEMPHKALTKLLFLAQPKTSDSTPLRKKVQEMVEKDEAQILETQVVVCKNGQKATGESIHEFIYPTEYEPPQLPEKNSESSPGSMPKGSVAPGEIALPTAFDTRNLGSTLEVEAKLTNNDQFVDLRLAPELVWHTGNTVWLESKDTLGNVSNVQMPDIYVIRFNTAINCAAGKYLMTSVLSPKDANGELDPTRKIMVFVKCNIVGAK